MISPSSSSKNKPSKIKAGRKQRQREEGSKKTRLVPYLAYSLTLKREATYSCQTLAEFQRTAWRYMSEVETEHSSVTLLYIQIITASENNLNVPLAVGTIFRESNCPSRT
jgi:hypothetical protein